MRSLILIRRHQSMFIQAEREKHLGLQNTLNTSTKQLSDLQLNYNRVT